MVEIKSWRSVVSSAQPGAPVGKRARMMERSMSLCVYEHSTAATLRAGEDL
eukprot:COSAG01_NODE_6072_length_3867_cov_176.980626_4_plen_51_part_00